MVNMTKLDPWHGPLPYNKYDAFYEAEYWTHRGLLTRAYFCRLCENYHLTDGVKVGKGRVQKS